jgi:D-3-phosphoglycerate dehydrogenase / 2-oxoglutarate reductase
MSTEPGHELCLFSAPFDFIVELRADRQPVPLMLREVWTRADLFDDSKVTAWIVNPGQAFVLSEADLARFPALKVVVTPSTGKNHVDVEACARRGVAFYSLLDDRPRLEDIAASAEFTFLLLLESLRKLRLGIDEVAAGRWRQREDDMRGHELQGRSVGLVGLGRIGRRMARYCSAFGAKVRYYDPYVQSDQVERVESLEALFEHSQSVVICCSLTPETERMIGGALLERLPPSATLVNSARGEIIDEAALARLLHDRGDVAVALDVLAGEVTATQFDSPLLPLFRKETRVTIAPHIAGATVESQSKAAMIALGLVEKHLRGASRGTNDVA